MLLRRNIQHLKLSTGFLTTDRMDTECTPIFTASGSPIDPKKSNPFSPQPPISVACTYSDDRRNRYISSPQYMHPFAVFRITSRFPLFPLFKNQMFLNQIAAPNGGAFLVSVLSCVDIQCQYRCWISHLIPSSIYSRPHRAWRDPQDQQ